MDAGVRNNISGKIEDIKTDNIMAQVTILVEGDQIRLTSVMTKDSLEEAGFKNPQVTWSHMNYANFFARK